MVQSILLVISVIILTMSFVYDKSVKELIHNPPTEIVQLFQDTADTAAAVADDTAAVAADTKTRMEQATE